MGILKEGREWKQIWWYSLSSPGQGMPGCSGMLGNTVVDRKDKRKPIVSICCFSSPVTKQMCEQTKTPTPYAIEMMNTMNVHDLKKNCRPRITFTEQLKWWRMEWVCQGYYSFSIFISFYFDLVFQFSDVCLAMCSGAKTVKTQQLSGFYTANSLVNREAQLISSFTSASLIFLKVSRWMLHLPKKDSRQAHQQNRVLLPCQFLPGPAQAQTVRLVA